jgi:hypothetical protein
MSTAPRAALHPRNQTSKVAILAATNVAFALVGCTAVAPTSAAPSEVAPAAASAIRQLPALPSAQNPIRLDPQWRSETIAFPLAFAPDLTFKGDLHIRFSPDWRNFDSPGGFSYVFVWNVSPATLDEASLAGHMQVYFGGLMKRVGEGRKLPNASATQAVFKPAPHGARWSQAWAGTVDTWNAFGKGEPLRLSVEASSRVCASGKQQVFFAVAKFAADTPAWRPLADLRESTLCAL